MSEIVGHAPIFLGLLLNNQNNNNGNNPANNNANNGNATAVLQDRVAEVTYLKSLQLAEPILPHLLQTPNTAATKGPFPPLTQAQINFFKNNGYLVLSTQLTRNETSVLRSEAHDVIENIREGADDKIIHYSLNDEDKSSPRPSPIGNVIATFENTPARAASAPPIARLGCGIHTLLPRFRHITHHPFHRLLYTTLMGPLAKKTAHITEPLITQSQIIMKSGNNHGSAIAPHQDGCVSFTDPPSCLTYWYALEDSTRENGCLEVLPRSHLTEPLRQRVVKGEGGEPRFVDLEKGVWARRGGENENEGKSGNGQGGERYAYGLSRGDDSKEGRYVPLEVREGTLVLFHGNLMHRSGKGRMAYTFCVIDGEPEDGDMEKL